MRGHPGLISPSTDRRGYSAWIAIAASALALTALHFLPPVKLGALDLIGDSASAGYEAPGDSFPGSAFFYAEGAFDPAPDTAASGSAHVLALSNGPAAAAQPFTGRSALDRYRATNCLTSAIYYEAGNEPEDGQRAVAQVVLNRVRHPAWPHSVCGVVYQGSERLDTRCQFTFSCDGAMARIPSSASWARARRVAVQALGGDVFAPVGLATHYHTLAVRPDWSGRLTPVAVVGAHIFYRMRGLAGASAAFSMRYTGQELQGGPSPRPRLLTASILPVAPIIAMPDQYAPAKPLSENQAPRATLPESTIRREFQNTGRPLP